MTRFEKCWGTDTGKGKGEIQTRGNYPEESILHSEHGESLKSIILAYAWIHTNLNPNVKLYNISLWYCTCKVLEPVWFLCFHESSYMGLLGPAWCKLFSANFFITLFALRVSDVIHIHPQERYIMYMQMVQCTYLYHLHVHYISLLRMDVYYIRNM